ncbi:unnamed protein product [Rhizophagus irregularis]|nr:unnamed protein product [Rhizophagus irregularis]
MPTLSCDPAYSQLLDMNQELRSDLQDEIFNNKTHEKEVEKLKSEISDLRKQLRVLQQDKKFKDEVGSIQDGRIIELKNKVRSLKARIRILIDKKISINALNIATTNLIANVNRGLDRIKIILGELNLLHDLIQRVDNLRNQFTDSRNQNLRLQRLLDEFRVQVERTVRERDNAQGE